MSEETKYSIFLNIYDVFEVEKTQGYAIQLERKQYSSYIDVCKKASLMNYIIAEQKNTCINCKFYEADRELFEKQNLGYCEKQVGMGYCINNIVKEDFRCKFHKRNHNEEK